MKKEVLLEKASTEFKMAKETNANLAIEPVPYDDKVKELIRTVRKRNGIKLESASSHIGSVEDLKALQPDFMAISVVTNIPRFFCFKKRDDGTIVKSLIFTNDGTSPFKNEVEQSEDVTTGSEVSVSIQKGVIYSTVETMNGEFITYNNK